MGTWLLTALLAGAAGLGVTLSLVNVPKIERPAHATVQQDAAAQARIAFEFLVREYLRRNTAFVGTLTAADLKTAGLSSGSLTNGSFSPNWSATVVTGGDITFCASVPARSRPALLNSGYTLESLTCGN